MKEFYLMRHGQTRFNVQNRLQGVCDAPLTEIGRDQARQVRAYFEKHHMTFDQYYCTTFDQYYCTTTERSSDTIELATGRTDYKRVKGLKEMYFGIFEGQPEYLHPKALPDGQGFGDFFVQFGGESTTQVRDRMELTVRAIMESVAEGSKSLLVSHGPSILQFCRRVLDPAPDMHGLKNCSILHFTYDQGQFELVSIYNPVEEEYIYGGEG